MCYILFAIKQLRGGYGMQMRFMGNGYQSYLASLFEKDILSGIGRVKLIRGKEAIVYNYIETLSSIMSTQQLSSNKNPQGIYANYSNYKKCFVNYWRDALNISRADSNELEKIFDDSIISQKQANEVPEMHVYLNDDKAQSCKDCLIAIYDVFEIFDN